MRVIPPVTITPAKLISSTLSDIHAPAAYVAGTTYGVGAIVSVAADFKIYESLTSSNLGNTPSTSPAWWRALGATETAYNSGTAYAIGATVSEAGRVFESLTAANTGNALPVYPETETTNWIYIGPTNKWACLDLDNNTQSVTTGTFTVVIAPGERVNSLAVVGMAANSLTVSATSVYGGGTVYGPEVIDLNTRLVVNGYDYCFNAFGTQPSEVFFDLPPFSDLRITVTLTSTSGNVKCGGIVTGTYVYLGEVLSGARNDGLNFSTIERDLYGKATLVPRRTVPKINVQTQIDASLANKCRSARVALNAVPALYCSLEAGSASWFDSFLSLGIYKTFEINADNSLSGTINFEIEEI